MTAPSIKEALELKPCPFCNGDAESDSQRHYRSISTGNLEKSAAIYCTKCNADMTWCYRDTPEIEREQVMVLLTEQWNTRTPENIRIRKQVRSRHGLKEPIMSSDLKELADELKGFLDRSCINDGAEKFLREVESALRSYAAAQEQKPESPSFAAGFEAGIKAAKEVADHHAIGNGDEYDDADIGGCTTAMAISDTIAAISVPDHGGADAGGVQSEYERGFEAGRKSWGTIIEQNKAYTAELESALSKSAPVAANASAEARLREAKLTSEELRASIADQRRRYQTVVLKPDQVDLLLAEIWAERTLRVEATREAFRTGWYINAAEAGDGEDQHPADYLERCEEVDWQEYKRVALSTHPHASDCDK